MLLTGSHATFIGMVLVTVCPPLAVTSNMALKVPAVAVLTTTFLRVASIGQSEA